MAQALRSYPLPVRKGTGAPSRIVIEQIQPELDGGLFPVKRIVGDLLQVSADIFRDGHDKIAACMRLRETGSGEWTEAALHLVDNDRWAGSASLTRPGRSVFVIEAWTDAFASWSDEVQKKRGAGQAIELELMEGRAFLKAAAGRSAGESKQHLEDCLRRLDGKGFSEIDQYDLLTSPVVGGWMADAADRSDAALSPEREVSVDRAKARFSTWYEMFPRSQGQTPGQSATFRDCIKRLPDVRDMGFDVVYLVPIHPIGEINRKGRNNLVRAEAGDPGSPYAIGSRTGGHSAIEPGLGSLEDFRKFVRAARDNGLEIALDFAVQCAPDHPWVKEHPGWFRKRADGSMKFAENPPKKYEDIVNVDFDQPDWRALWEELANVVRFWIGEGVRIFRVDNPHTKPFAFWHWLIDEIQAEDPDVLFLAEAFTRPKIMRRLAKEGFSQSYTYFTWRNTKAELTDYLTELTRGESAEYLRPNFFTNTPDILPFFLQEGGRAAFRIRLVLAATLSSTYGIYSGFELCENDALPGREEYRDSEKYEFKVRDWDRPGNIKDDIRKLNALRAGSEALQRFDNLEFHPSSHPSVLFYSKSGQAGGGRIIVAVTVDPRQVAETDVEFPASVGGRFTTEELFSGWRQDWIDTRQRIRIDPSVQPALVWRLL